MRVSRWRVYIKPFDANGNYLSSWTEVTDDVISDSVSNIQQQLDYSEYDIGILRNSNINIRMRNDHGKYSDVDVFQSIFRYKRSGSLLKITWDLDEAETLLGSAMVHDSWIGEEVEIFQGFIDDDAATMDAESLDIQFSVLGRESVLDRTVVNFSSLAIGQTAATAIYNCLNTSGVTGFLTVSSLNISCGYNPALDAVAHFENKTAKEAMKDLLLISNSVMYLVGDSIMVAPREATPTVQYNFFGQASPDGVENIISIKNIRGGLSRTFNYLVWKDTTTFEDDITSTTKYGVRKKEIESSSITNGAKRTNVLTDLVAEFATPKLEFDLTTVLNYDTYALTLLDRVDVDYPTIYMPDDTGLPICGIAICGSAVLPRGLWAFSVSTAKNFVILSRTVDIKNSTIKYRLREI